MTDAAGTNGPFFFEDFVEGEILRHHRGKTMTEMDQVLITNLVMNTAAGHFDEALMKTNELFCQRVAFGGVTIALVIVLASQHTAQHAPRELSPVNIRLKAVLFHGRHTYTYSQLSALS